jgi:hypothetical protein
MVKKGQPSMGVGLLILTDEPFGTFFEKNNYPSYFGAGLNKVPLFGVHPKTIEESVNYDKTPTHINPFITVLKAFRTARAKQDTNHPGRVCKNPPRWRGRFAANEVQGGIGAFQKSIKKIP